MKLNYLIFYGMSILGILILLDKPIDNITLVSKMLGNLISGYLGFLVGNSQNNSKKKE